MLNNSDETQRKEIINKILSHINQNFSEEQVNSVIALADYYYSNVAIEELQERDPFDLYNMLISHWELMQQRKAQEAKIHIFNPHFEQHGWQSTHTVVEIVVDDMPFVVDSLRMEINRHNFAIHFMINIGNVKVKRNKKGELLAVYDATHAAEDAISEALVHMQIDRESDPSVLHELQEDLQRVLNDVRTAVTDWKKMRERMHETLAELEKYPPPFDPLDVRESEDFLRWLDNDHFTYLGARDYELIGEGKDQALKIVSNSGLGVLRNESNSKTIRPFSTLPPAAQKLANAKHVLVISKTNTKATIHRPVYTDYIGVKRFNEKGELLGERRFIGLYTSRAYKSHPKDIPFLRRKIEVVMENSRLSHGGHSSKALIDILATLPRDDLFQASIEELTQLAMGILHVQGRQQIRLFVRQDTFRRFVSCLVYLPREQFNTELLLTIQDILQEAFSGIEISYEPLFSESSLVRVHYLIRTNPRVEQEYDEKQIEKKLIEAARSWSDDLRENLIEYYGEERGLELANRYIRAFPASYREDFVPRTAVFDIEHMEKLNETHTLEMNFYRPPGDLVTGLRFKLFQREHLIALSDVLPMLENMGLRVLDERPHEIMRRDGKRIWINDFGMVSSGDEEIVIDEVREIFQEAFLKVWFGAAENDGFNRLVLGAKITWREAALLRAYTKYLKQIGFTFSQAYIEQTLANNAAIAKQIIQLFDLWFNPTKQKAAPALIPALDKELQTSLNAVANLDEDRILRRFVEVIHATIRTNYYQKDAHGRSKTWIAFKLEPSRIADLPLPRPAYEIFVYSPQVEGIHLRAAKVARGGLRWSDRREDFRTEVLGLMKAQQVKNAVIVPSGAKGGFIPKNLPVDGTREEIMTEVVECYRTFIRGLLDLTDNLKNGVVVPPNDVVRYDDDDPYLVVAADKGTATFSDYANEISQEYDFWLSDAFASGGSAGYDHKKMGITARGAWESVKRHFRTLGINPEQDDITAIGIGDMSGDVFGNGLLRSRHIKLLAAFNHMHIFLDPNPDAETSFLERERLFNLPRSTWEDYNAELISAGGGVYKRSAKSIPLSPEVQAILGISQESLEPNALIRAILCAPVDLLWNGGIGTYVKANTERHVDVGDRANDAIRINGGQLRCRVVAEGGNLGFTQLGRVEYALNNGLIYTDFIDNSAGVDCSDHEVNCKILLNTIIANGDLTLKQRNKLLVDMTDEIAELVLLDNYQQTRAINLAVSRAMADFELYRGFIDTLEQAGKLDRSLEFLPEDKALLERKLDGKGLTSPEIAILLAYSKMTCKAELLHSSILDNEYLANALSSAFPSTLNQRYGNQLRNHSLRHEIIATQLSNAIINDMGITFIERMKSETGAETPLIVQAYMVAREVFDLQEMIELIENLSTDIKPELRYQLMTQVARLARRAARWFLRNHKSHLENIEETITRFKQGVKLLNEQIPNLLSGTEQEDWLQTIRQLEETAIPKTAAIRMATIKNQYALLDIIEASSSNHLEINQLAAIYFTLGDRLELAWLREQITDLLVDSQWTALGRAALRDDLDAQQRKLSIVALMDHSTKTDSLEQHMENWFVRHQHFVERWQLLLAELRKSAIPEFIMFAVVIRELVELARDEKFAIRRQRVTD